MDLEKLSIIMIDSKRIKNMGVEYPIGFKCILCGNKEYSHLFFVGGYSLVRCLNCGLVQTYPIEIQLDPDEYYDQECFLNLEKRKEHEFHYQGRILDFIMHHKTSGKMLEVGSGAGIFIELASRKGWEIEGIEPSIAASRYVSEKFDKLIHQGTLESIDFFRKRFDVIVLRHVLEHMATPISALIKLHDLLKPDGLLCIVVPNWGGLHAMLERERWFHLSIPFHVAHYNRKTLRVLMDIGNFNILEMRTFDLTCSSYLLFLMSQFKKFTRKSPINIHVSPRETDTTKGVRYRIISKERLFNEWTARIGFGDELAVLASKRSDLEDVSG